MTWQDQNETAQQYHNELTHRRGIQRGQWLKRIEDEIRLIRNARVSAKRRDNKSEIKQLQTRLDRLLKWKCKLKQGVSLQYFPKDLFQS